MKAIELEVVIIKVGSKLSEIHLNSGESFAPCEVVSLCAGKNATLWVSTLGEELFLSVDQILSIKAI